MNLPMLTPTDVAKLGGKEWEVKGVRYFLGKEPTKGGEAYLVPLYNNRKKLVAYARIIDAEKQTPQRLKRTSWLIGQQLNELSTVFKGAPQAWLNSYEAGRPSDFGQDLVATLHEAIPGKSWRGIKIGARNKKWAVPSIKIRIEAAKNLIAALATLECIGPYGFLHGDLSDGNIIIDLETGKCYLIDFDAFVFTASQTLKHHRLTYAEGGVLGTPGYMPPCLEDEPRGDWAPISDRHARDLLLIELLAYGKGALPDTPPKYWTDIPAMVGRLETWAKPLGLTHLLDPTIFVMAEQERPSSIELAIAVGARMPACSIPLTMPEQSCTAMGVAG